MAKIKNETTTTGYVDLTSKMVALDKFHCFRGEPDESWNLIPSMFRGIDNSKQKIEDKDAQEFFIFERDVYREFSKLAAGQKEFIEANNYWERLFVAQHYGTPTRLLDWTTNFLVATYFACVSHPEADGAVYCLNVDEFPFSPALGRRSNAPLSAFSTHNVSKAISQQDISFLQPVSTTATFSARNSSNGTPYYGSFFALIESPHFNGRIENQKGLFSVFVTDRDSELDEFEYVMDHGKYFSDLQNQTNTHIWSRIVIPKSLKPEIQRSLTRVGISAASIFPDLVGVGAFQKMTRDSWFTDYILRYKSSP